MVDAVAVAVVGAVAVGAAVVAAAGVEMSDWRYWLIVVFWAVWEGYWIASSRSVKRATQKEPLASRIPVLIGLVLAPCLLLAPGWFGSLMDRSFTWQTDATYLPGLALALCGMAFAFWARHTLGRNWSGRVTIKEDHELVTAGPYRYVRHPIYTGALLGFAGSTLALGRAGGIFAVAIMLMIFAHKIRLEEQMLDKHFGERYAAYKKSTHAVIPLIW
ncbi:MAG TPA: isoprenylcysteine carboxylmethyltransferase family protein [Gammaproteobacteria bacterium]